MTKASDLLNDNTARDKKSSAMAVNEQTARSTQLTVDESSKAGAQLAIAEMKSFAVGYGETSQKLSGVLETELDKIRRSRHEAIASASLPKVEGDVADFLTEFEQDLQSLLAPTT